MNSEPEATPASEAKLSPVADGAAEVVAEPVTHHLLLPSTLNGASAFFGNLFLWRVEAAEPSVASLLMVPDSLIGPRGPAYESGEHLVRDFGEYSSFDPNRPHVLPVPLAGRTPPKTSFEETTKWYDGYRQVPVGEVQARVSYLEAAIATWLAGLNEAPYVELRAILAIVLVADGGLWRDYRRPNGDRPFKSANHFIQTYLSMWGCAFSASRVSRRKASGRLWMRLQAVDQPLPTTLARLELFGKRSDAVKIYQELTAEAGGNVPTESAIQQKLATVDGRRARRKLPISSKATVRKRYTQELYALVDAETLDHQRLKAKLQQIRDLDKPRLCLPRPVVPRYDATLACPLTLSENGDEYSITVALPEPWFQVVRREIKPNWRAEQKENDRLVISVERSKLNLSAQRAVRGEVNDWAERICRKIGAQAPIFLPHPLPSENPGQQS